MDIGTASIITTTPLSAIHDIFPRDIVALSFRVLEVETLRLLLVLGTDGVPSRTAI